MPIYEFQCPCGIRFEAEASMKDNQKPHPCPDCGALAPRWVPRDVAGTFNVKTKGMTPQNTGIHSMDTNWDRTIGKDSEDKWIEFGRHYKDKEAFMRANGVGRSDISRNPDGTYRVLRPEEKAIHKRALDINEKAMEAIRITPRTSRPLSR